MSVNQEMSFRPQGEMRLIVALFSYGGSADTYDMSGFLDRSSPQQAAGFALAVQFTGFCPAAPDSVFEFVP